MLVDHPKADVAVLAVWIPMLGGDSRSDIDSGVLDDPRVTSFWDGDRIFGSWLADQRVGDLSEPGAIVWDAYLAFAPEASWQTTPDHLVAAGSDIIDTTDALSEHFLPLLATRIVTTITS